MKTSAMLGWTVMSVAAVACGSTAGRAENACKADVQKFCSDVDRSDRKAIHACMKSHASDLSDGCKSQMAKMHAKRHQAPSSGTPPPVNPTLSSPATNPAH